MSCPFLPGNVWRVLAPTSPARPAARKLTISPSSVAQAARPDFSRPAGAPSYGSPARSSHHHQQRIIVKYRAGAKSRAGSSVTTVAVPQGSSVEDTVKAYAGRAGEPPRPGGALPASRRGLEPSLCKQQHAAALHLTALPLPPARPAPRRRGLCRARPRLCCGPCARRCAVGGPVGRGPHCRARRVEHHHRQQQHTRAAEPQCREVVG